MLFSDRIGPGLHSYFCSVRMATALNPAPLGELPMNDVKLTHPSLDQLTAFGQGRLSEAELAELSSHLGECSECREKVEASGDDTLISLLRAADTKHDPE